MEKNRISLTKVTFSPAAASLCLVFHDSAVACITLCFGDDRVSNRVELAQFKVSQLYKTL